MRKSFKIIHKIRKKIIKSLHHRKLFLFWQKLGIHVIQNHYYQPIPDTRELCNSLWEEPSELIGVNLNEQTQLKLLAIFVERFKSEYEAFPRNKGSIPYQYYVNNGAFESVDGEILYCMLRLLRPRKIFEIGAGYSTYLSAQALQKNMEETNIQAELIVCEPFPNKIISQGFSGLSKLIVEKIQKIPLAEFNMLNENDVLFIDSSHMLKIGSDVQYEYLEILPRLKKGVIVHIHDIFLPAEYPKKWILNDYRFWNEQYLLQAFLSFNDSFEVLWAGSYMHMNHPEHLTSAFSSYDKERVCPGSFWLKKIK